MARQRLLKDWVSLKSPFVKGGFRGILVFGLRPGAAAKELVGSALPTSAGGRHPGSSIFCIAEEFRGKEGKFQKGGDD